MASNTTKVQDALFRTTYYAYDLIDRLTSVTDALSNSSYFFYDPASNRNIEMDANRHSAYYFYDANNRLAVTRDALGVAAYYGYDANSNLVRTVDNNRTLVYFTYDALDRRSQIVYPTESQYFGYDAAGNLAAMRDAWGGSYFAYDTLNRLSQRSNPRPDAIYYGYDATSDLLRLQYPVGGVSSSAGSTCYYGYDLALRNDRLVSPNLSGAYFGYDAFSNIVSKKYGNGMLAYFTYDRVNRVTSIRYFTSTGAPVAYFDYNRDVAGRILTIGRETDLAIYYAYDNIDRLTRETWRKKSDFSQIYAFSYSYDPANNRLTMRRESSAGTETSSAYYSYAADNSLTQLRVQTPPSTLTDTYYLYDANGAVVKIGNNLSGYTYFEYGANQLVTKIYSQFVMPAQQKVFSYDGQLNRYKLQFGAAYTADLLWDGLNLLEDRRSDFTGNLRMTYGPSRIYGIGSNVEVYDDARMASTFLAMDHRGTAHVAIDETGAEYGRRYYDAFGVIINETGHWRTLLGYQTNWLTSNQIPGYLLSKYRVYESATGVFLSRDFLPYINKYRAFSNNPVGQVDRDGLADHETKPDEKTPPPTPDSKNKGKVKIVFGPLGLDNEKLDMAFIALFEGLSPNTEYFQLNETDTELKEERTEQISYMHGNKIDYFRTQRAGSVGDIKASQFNSPLITKSDFAIAGGDSATSNPDEQSIGKNNVAYCYYTSTTKIRLFVAKDPDKDADPDKMPYLASVSVGEQKYKAGLTVSLQGKNDAKPGPAKNIVDPTDPNPQGSAKAGDEILSYTYTYSYSSEKDPNDPDNSIVIESIRFGGDLKNQPTLKYRNGVKQ